MQKTSNRPSINQCNKKRSIQNIDQENKIILPKELQVRMMNFFSKVYKERAQKQSYTLAKQNTTTPLENNELYFNLNQQPLHQKTEGNPQEENPKLTN
ncbi:hypothetical protein FACS189418_8910 [Clostridia bacterium]|nr:hypothetical protein FACS189418_8910 [Clostridia bacterium]